MKMNAGRCFKICKGEVEGGGDEFRLKGKTNIAHTQEEWEQKRGKWIRVLSTHSWDGHTCLFDNCGVLCL